MSCTILPINTRKLSNELVGHLPLSNFSNKKIFTTTNQGNTTSAKVQCLPSRDVWWTTRPSWSSWNFQDPHNTLRLCWGDHLSSLLPDLKGDPIKSWFKTLKLIDNFKEMGKKFLIQFMGSRIRMWPITYLFCIKQQEDESMKDYPIWINKKWLTMEDQNEKITLATLLGRI